MVIGEKSILNCASKEQVYTINHSHFLNLIINCKQNS